MKYISLQDIEEKTVSHNSNIKKKVFINSEEIPHITNFAQANLASGQISYAHKHDDMWEVFYVESGEGIIKINDQDFPFKKGVCVVVKPLEKHEIINNGNEDLVINYFGIKDSK